MLDDMDQARDPDARTATIGSTSEIGGAASDATVQAAAGRASRARALARRRRAPAS